MRTDALMREHVRHMFGEISTYTGALGASKWRERRAALATSKIRYARGFP